MKRKWNRLLALLLCVLMMSSEFTGLITPAQAAPAAPDEISEAAPLADTTTTENGAPKDFDADVNARPNLFVHFLGDNYYYPHDSGVGGVNQGIGLGQLPVPAGFDQSKETNPDSTDPGAGPMDTPGNAWNRYRDPTGDMVAETATSGPQVIFWVGLGVDRREIFQLLKDNKGLTSLEAGFYYDNRYVEPYVDPSGDFKATIEKANINNHSYPANTQWSSDYEILRAETGLETKTDAITQEEVTSPSFDQIMADSNWKMTYVSLELTDPLKAGTDRRLAGEYVGVDNLPTDGNGDPITPDSAHGTGMQNAGGKEEDNDYQYLLLIPFRLKRYGDPQRLALRLARNATHFSMGAGEEGEKTYAAWERVTTRNPGKDIKLLTRFNGDLFLFGDPPNSGEVEYTATLYLDQKTVLNTAELSVDGDPAVWPVKATQNKDVISGLRSGLGMRIKTDPQIGYTVSVTVKYKDADGNYIIHTYQTVTTDREYTFVMPEVPNQVKDVEVHIGFSIDNPQYHVFLSEIDRDSLGAVTTDKKLGNSTVITTNLDNITGAATPTTVEIHSFDPPFDPHPGHPIGSLLDPHGPGPMGDSDTGNRVKIEVSTHADYMAVVRIGNFNATGSLITSDLNITTARNDHRVELDTTSPNYGKITLPYGGTITLTMPANDLDVEITYQPAPRYKATLEVYHKAGSTVTPMNTAQMAYLIYDDFNDSSTAYSGVVYHLKDDTVPVEDHRAVKGGADNKKLPWVAASQATQSGSLAGDTGRTGMEWNPGRMTPANDPILGLYTVMTQLRSATDLASFAPSMAAVDLNSQAVGSAWTGIRKDLQGQSYGDGDVAQLKSYLWELRTRILGDPALKALYDKTVTETVGTTTTTLYSYLDLTAAQVQAYVLDILTAQETERANQRQYDLAYQAYLAVKALRDVEDAKPSLSGMIAPLDAPIPPEWLSPADSQGIRSYQGTDYQNGGAGDYLYDYYAYLNSYRTYITAVAATGSVSGIDLPGAAPGKKALHTIDLLTDAAAQAKLAGFHFQANPVSASPTIETREDRRVWVALEGDGAYYVESVRLYDVDGFNNPTNLITTIVPTKDSSYANLWSFTMPKKNCAVRVTYAKRATRDLMVQIIDANGESENLASVEAYRHADHDPRYPTEVPSVAPVLDKITNDGNQNVTPYPPAPTTPLPSNQADPRYIYNVFIDGTVTVRVKAKEGYSTEVKFENLGRGDAIPYTKVAAPDPADGDIYTFTVVDTNVANDVISVKITYIEEKEQYDAYIDYYTVPGSTPNPDNEALWRLESAGPPVSVTWTDYIPDVYVGTHLVGDVTVQPGYYIYGVVARGASGNYTYIMSGDGYNNGYGTMVSGTNQPVKIDVNMPAEDLYVEVYFKEGPPPAEPDYPLTLTVHDPDNRDPNNKTDDISQDDPTKWVNNWAKATVYDLKPDGTPDTSSPLVTLGEVGRKQASMTDHTFTQRGKWVKVEFEAVTGYHVSKVTVGPSELGVAIIWESANSVSFYMPAGSTGICVEFAKGEPPAYFLNVRETWFDMTINGPVTGAEQDNYVTYASSGTIKGWNAGNPVQLRYENNPERVPGAGASTEAKGAAVSGEEVTMTYIVDENNWYVQSIILFSDGAATRLTDNAVEISDVGGKKTFEVKFHMPSSDAEFTVHYRKGPRPKQNDYAFTMVLYDSDNTGSTKDDNRLSATFTDATGGVGVHPRMELGLALATPITTDVRHIHPGDTVTLETKLQPGYTVDYMIINPSNLGLYPSWQSVVTDASGVTKGVAKFTMPSEGVAVVARYIKGDPHKYTANLILRPPAGYTVDDVGMGTFAAPTAGNFTNYPTQAIFSTAQSPGTAIDYDLYAKDGFYIKRVTIEPAVGATGSLTGSFGYQNGDFVMPAANVYVNVWFEKGWPDEATYDLTLRVHDAAERDGNYANFHCAGSTLFTSPDSDHVHGGQVRTVRDAAFDRDVVVVNIAAEAGYYCDPQCIVITDTQGNSLNWWHVPGGIAFTMPPRSTTVDITFKEDPGDRPTYEARLRVIDPMTGQAVPADNDEVKLEALSIAATGSPLTANGTIGNLHPHDALKLTTRPGTGRHVAAAYAVYTAADGTTGAVPIYADGALTAPPALAQMVPGDPANAATGGLVMPEGDVTVYVRFADKALRDTDKWVTLKVSGPAEAGHATALVNEGVTAHSMSVRTPGSTTPAAAVSGMDTYITTPGREVIVTFEPKTGDGYDITKLEVYDRNGNLVPYQWLSMVQDPPVLTDTDVWPNPPTDPSPGIGHPGWVKNPKRQIKLSVPLECVTVHVTYGKVDQNKEFTAQIVVNDPYPANTTPASRNNAWFGLLDDALKARIRTAKPGEWIDLSVNVHPGYRIEYIKVVPQSYGIAPGLPMGDIYDQNTGFYMPNGDVTVYVKFVTDDTERKTATVMAIGAPTGNPANYATIHSPINGTSDHATVNGLSRVVEARPVVDWITVDYYWAADSAIESITVQTKDGSGGTDIPYTQNEDFVNRHGQIVLPMAARDVLITIVYKNDPTPVGQEVVLHVIDKDRGVPAPIVRDPDGATPLNYGRLKAVYAVGADTGLIGPNTAPLATDPYESTATIFVPAGERVDVTACSDALGLDGNSKVYIESAYVLYEAGGQMLNMNLQPDSVTPPPYGFSGLKDSHFIVHQGRNDVYVTLTRQAPTQNEYSAVLMLKGPDDNAGQAGICVGSSYDTAPVNRRDELTQANHGHAYVTATQGEGITINVVPAEGYVIDYIQVTPLGYPLSYTFLPTENTINFDMPHCNIAVTVYLKKAEKDQHTLTLHYLEDTGNESKDDYARISWTKDDGTQEDIWAWEAGNVSKTPPGAVSNGWDNVSSTLVKGGAPVTLWATLDDPDVILAAYVLSEGELVPLTPTFPAGLTPADGLEGVGESASAGDNAKADALATFDMPNADAHVYLVTTNTPPHPDWHTIILTASDTSPAGNNRGVNYGYLNEKGKPDSDRKKVWSYGGTSTDPLQPDHVFLSLPEYQADGTTLNYFTVVTEPAPTYELSISKTHMTKNTPVYIQALSPVGTTPTVHYEEPVGDCNKVVHLVFESQEDLTLTVEIDDPDNPGNGTVTNAVTTATTGVDTLHLYSQSIAGAYQIMSGVTAGAPVDLTVTPAPGYYAYAYLYTVGADPVEVPLTVATNGVMTGSFTMPPNTSRVVVTFYLPYDGTLVLRDNTGYPTTKAQMTESTGTAPDRVSVNALLTTSATLTKLPNGTELVANMVDYYGVADADKKVTGLLTTQGSTTFLAPVNDAGVDYYKHTIDRADATITLVVDEKGVSGEDYVAAVRVVNRPDTLTGAQMPTIVDTTTAGKVSGSIWTTADDTDGIKVHVTVPAGYTAQITTDRALGLDGGTGTTKTLTADGDTTFVMPAANVQVTVTYVRTHHRLTLHIADTSGVAGNATALTPAAGSVLGSGLTSLTADGQSTYVKDGAAVDLSAIPAADAKIKYIFYQVAGQPPQFVTVTDPTNPFSAVPLLNMPAADVDVTVVYTIAKTPDPPPDPDPMDYYIALAVKDDPSGDPGNQILSIRNTTRTTLLNGAALPSASPVWTAGYGDDAVQVTYQAAPGYYVQVTAKAADGTPILPVLQVGDTTLGNATTAFPTVGEDIVITVTYTTEKPPRPEQDVALQLVEHKQEAGNKAQTTDFTDSALLGLSLNGTHTDHAPGYTPNVVSDDPVEIIRPKSTAGNDLRTLANWATSYQVVRMTVAVRNTTTNAETGEVDLLVSRYGGNATSRCPMPPVGADEIAVVRVYYGNIYDATLHVVGADLPHDVTKATDNRPNPISSTGTVPITDTGDKLIGFQGGEQVQTTAIPDTAAAGGVKKRLVGVVWESDLTGAQPTTSTVADRYDFNMPKDNVDFYAIYEPEPDDPKDKTYIAKVALDSKSQPIAGTQNALSIRNTNDTTAAKGKYWVAAKGGDGIEVNVKVAKGYQAQIIATKVDDQSASVLNALPDILDADGVTTRKPTAADDYQYDITRTQFVYNLPDGKEAAFTMPADTDATVTVRFIKGYDLTLDVADASLLDKTGFTSEENTVDLAYDFADHLKWKNDAATADATVTTDGAYDPDPAVLKDREGGKSVTTEVTTYDPDIKVKVTRTTPFTGTAILTNTAPATNYPFTMPYENTAVSVLLRDKDAEDDLLAKVELKGDSDVVGNTATPVVDEDTPIPATTTGVVWTTTDEGHLIDLTLTVRAGYVAKIQVRRDNDNYYNNPTDPTKWDYLDAWRYQFTKVTTSGSPATTTAANMVSDPGAVEANITEVSTAYAVGYLPASAFPDTISGQQHFQFLMPSDVTAVGTPGDPGYVMGDQATDVTIIVTFEKVNDMPRPYDPDNLKMDKIDLDRGFIYGENRGDYAIIEIPTLAQEEGESTVKLFDTDNYDTVGSTPVIHDTNKAADKEVKRYIFALHDAATDKYTELVEGTDVLLVPYDEDELVQTGDLYNYILGLYNGSETLDAATAKRDFVGSKFLLLPKPQDDGTFTPNGQKLYDMLDNNGSLERYQAEDKTTRYRTTLAVMAEDATRRQSEYTPVWIRPWFALGVNVISYAPTHELHGQLYRLMDEHELNVRNGYWDEDENPTGAVGVTQMTPDEEDIQHYRWEDGQEPTVDDFVVLEDDVGSGKWFQLLRIRSSELLGPFTTDYDPTEDFTATPAKTLLSNVKPGDVLTYALLVEKAANLTYTRIKIDLNPHNYSGGTALADYYMNGDPATRTFLVQDTVQLIAGDVDGNKRVKRQDYDVVYDFVYRNRPWNTIQTEPVEPAAPEPPGGNTVWNDYRAALEEWSKSVYNPNSWSYRCDLDGDGRLTIADIDIVRTRFNYNRTEADYLWHKSESGVTVSILPFGLGARSNDYASLFALGTLVEGETGQDEYWDSLADLDSEEAEPLDTIWVDEDGQTWTESRRPDTPVTDDGLPQPKPQPGDRVEVPLGEEALGQLEFLRPGPDAILTQEDLSPDERVDISEGAYVDITPDVPDTSED